MPILRNTISKIMTKISPSSSPATSPTSPQVSSFEVVSGRKQGGMTVTRAETDIQMRMDRKDSFITEGSNSSKENVNMAEKRQKRMSRFREELDIGDD